MWLCANVVVHGKVHVNEEKVPVVRTVLYQMSLSAERRLHQYFKQKCCRFS